LDISYGSACEVSYQISLAHRLEFLPEDGNRVLSGAAHETCKVLNALNRSLRGQS
jgi:four helix bundle protein